MNPNNIAIIVTMAHNKQVISHWWIGPIITWRRRSGVVGFSVSPLLIASLCSDILPSGCVSPLVSRYLLPGPPP